MEKAYLDLQTRITETEQFIANGHGWPNVLLYQNQIAIMRYLSDLYKVNTESPTTESKVVDETGPSELSDK